MLIISKDLQRIEIWQKASGARADIVASVKEAETNLSGNASVCVVDMVSLSVSDQSRLESLIKARPANRFLIFTAVPDAQEGVSWISAGAKGYCNRLVNKEIFQKVLETVNKDEIWAGQVVVQHLLGRLQSAGHKGSVTGLSMLTQREREIADFVGNGMNNKEISQELTISESTVKAHLNKIFKKMNVETRVQLALELEKAKTDRAAIQYS